MSQTAAGRPDGLRDSVHSSALSLAPARVSRPPILEPTGVFVVCGLGPAFHQSQTLRLRGPYPNQFRVSVGPVVSGHLTAAKKFKCSMAIGE
ncbi:hypothetical protein AbraIFM66951_004570 [Aspergillus brasiliensis]|uniref:Uncharacterized protein n=1 Tax=Aspergillus brasiliensis TaxID=319629 RepID=A0A9W5YVW9_9EURO|nr:hypothetical protein AbraCBS73388_010269 [Aspergillus brasiliensis]GKZ50878.1 hypothetical protein AbraIFM66951_004570 [Aspergillus brasiliensis]